MTAQQIGWVSGYLEGEGYFALSTPHPQYPYYKAARVIAGSTDKEPLQKLVNFIGGTLRGPYKKAGKNWKPFWRWNLSQRIPIISLLHKIYPLMSPRRQARIRECLNAI